MQTNLYDMANSDGVSIHSGFPNPGLDRRGQGARLALDLNQLLVQHPSSTYLFRVTGHSSADQNIYDGDILVVDRAVRVRPTDLVIASIDNNLVIGKYRRFAPSVQTWGVITSVIHQYHAYDD